MTKHRKPQARGSITRNTILEIVTASDQPLIAREVQGLLAKRGIKRDGNYVLQILNELADSNLVSSRLETADERMIRTDDNRGKHFASVYFWAPAGKVPFRTKRSTVELIPRRPNKRVRAKNKKPVTVSASAKAFDVNGLMQRIESMTNELALIQRVAELEAQLETVRKAIR